MGVLSIKNEFVSKIEGLIVDDNEIVFFWTYEENSLTLSSRIILHIGSSFSPIFRNLSKDWGLLGARLLSKKDLNSG